MLPSIAYDWVSVVPAGGSTMNTAATMNETMTSVRARGREPRATASSPAPTPTAATMAAAHRLNRATSLGRPRYTHHGGPPAVCGIAGTLTDGPATDIAIITRSETVMQAVAVQTSPRFWPGDPYVPVTHRIHSGDGCVQVVKQTVPDWSFRIG